MTKALVRKTSTEQGLLTFLQDLLKNKVVSGVFSLKVINKDGDIAYALITNPDDLKDARPFYPLMPENAGLHLSRFTLKGTAKQPVLAVVKPCELRGFVELIKREQGNLDKLITMSATCGGVFPIKMAVSKDHEKHLSKYWESVKKGEIHPEIRSVCKACENFEPYTADITVDLLGNSKSDAQLCMYFNTNKGKELATALKTTLVEKDSDKKTLDAIRKKRTAEKQRLFADIQKQLNGIDGLVNIFGRCIGCHGCSKVCPICYCRLCEFESPEAEYNPAHFESEFKKKGAMKVPPGTLYYQLGRLSHIGISCVACGQCEDVCPVDIPVAMIFKYVGESIQTMFEYVPGKNRDEKIPLITFNKEEFAEIEE